LVEQAAAEVNQGDLKAEPAQGRRHLHADEAATDDDGARCAARGVADRA
jgi:hypothetical protein